MITVGSVFSGIGGLDLGLERAKMKVIWQVENDKSCNSILERHWPEVERHGDITELRTEKLVRPELICGGFPCQDLSIAGKRAGLAGKRSGLFYEFMRIVADLTPKWVLIENVPGLLSSNKGRDMGTVIGALVECGYGWAYRILDAKHFGVPQRRRRVFIVGCLGNPSLAAKVLFEPESLSGYPATRKETGENITRSVVGSLDSGGSGSRNAHGGAWPGTTVQSASAGHCSTTSSHGNYKEGVGTLRNNGGDMGGGSENIVSMFLNTKTRMNSGKETFVFDWQSGGDVRHNVNANNTSALQASQIPAVWHENKSDNLTMDDKARALRAGASHSYQGTGVRRLTPIECERLQGFPDNWTQPLSDTARYRSIGNAVCVPVSTWIGYRITQLL